MWFGVGDGSAHAVPTRAVEMQMISKLWNTLSVLEDEYCSVENRCTSSLRVGPGTVHPRRGRLSLRKGEGRVRVPHHWPSGVVTSVPGGALNSIRCSRGRYSDNAVHFSFKPTRVSLTISGVIHEPFGQFISAYIVLERLPLIRLMIRMTTENTRRRWIKTVAYVADEAKKPEDNQDDYGPEYWFPFA